MNHIVKLAFCFVALIVLYFANGILNPKATKSALNEYIEPNFSDFVKQSNSLLRSLNGLCGSPDFSKTEHARKQFGISLESFAKIEFLKFGPAAKNNNRERLWFWPDRRSIGLRQIQRVLVTKDETVLDPATLKSKSVALQGFGPLEYLLFGNGSNEISVAGGRFRCVFAASVATNVRDIAQEMSDGWSNPRGYQNTWLTPGNDNPIYKNEAESLVELVAAIALSFQSISDLILAPMAPGNGIIQNSRKAPFWRSKQTQRFMAGTVKNVMVLITTSGILDRSPNLSNSLKERIAAIADRTIHNLIEIGDGLKRNSDPVAQKEIFTETTENLYELANIFARDVPEALKLPLVFSALDGD